MTRYGWFVEYLTNEPPNNSQRTFRFQGKLIKTSIAAKSGDFRNEETFRCPSCTGTPGREPGTLATTRVAPGGTRIVHIPQRQMSAGSESSRTMPEQALSPADLCTGVHFTQCRRCLMFYALMGYRVEGDLHPEIGIIPVAETTFGRVDGEGMPTAVHKVPLVGPLAALADAQSD